MHSNALVLSSDCPSGPKEILTDNEKRGVLYKSNDMKDFEKKSLIPIKSGSGSWLIDFEGKKYLDTTSSWWVNLFGHNNSTIKSYINKQTTISKNKTSSLEQFL